MVHNCFMLPPLKYTKLSRPFHGLPSIMAALFTLPTWSIPIWSRRLLLPCLLVRQNSFRAFFLLSCIFYYLLGTETVKLGFRAVSLLCSSTSRGGDTSKISPQDFWFERSGVSFNLVSNIF